ncbi:MAG: hypothetical protein IJ656_02240 [Bacilli bacterium]|nr:hypothetical protein [Bacilli bacterium]
MNDLENLKVLFTGEKEEVYKALQEKSTWIDKVFYIPGNIDQSFDEHGKVHYKFIESVYNGTFLFKKIDVDSLKVDDDFKNRIRNFSNDLRILHLYDTIDKSIDVPFWIEVDFKKAELSFYRDLFPNFYRCLGEEVLSDLKEEDEAFNLFKTLIYGKTLQNSIILYENKLIDDQYYCPIMSKIYHLKGIDNSLIESLEEIANTHGVEVEEI